MDLFEPRPDPYLQTDFSSNENPNLSSLNLSLIFSFFNPKFPVIFSNPNPNGTENNASSKEEEEKSSRRNKANRCCYKGNDGASDKDEGAISDGTNPIAIEGGGVVEEPLLTSPTIIPTVVEEGEKSDNNEEEISKKDGEEESEEEEKEEEEKEEE
ncbi:unnamed protein product [Arabidopsis thaliana]|uniref:Uncharacterized protein n=1 Tax=Arabidopsis thaliana TaxID=3702 RepID=A0A654ESK6_ARATH|nr:unnamed protein product [Arabidopsis thaliana]